MGEALLLCLVGSLYPVALLAVLTYLGSARPLPTAAAFLAGGVIISFVTGTTLVVLFRQFQLNPGHRRTPSAGVYIGLGIGVTVAAAIWLFIDLRRRRSEQDSPDAPSAAEPTEKTLRTAFLAGALIYLPMLSYFAAIKIIADQNYDGLQTVAALIACVVVSLTVTELPIVVVALVGDRADAPLHAFARFVSKNTSTILLLTGLGVGVYLVVKGVGQL
jgi:quinol-cytochrome oxidoreductase complex cytochrome b subunit